MAEDGQEREWIIAARQGSDEAFANLVEVYQVPVYNLCHRMLSDPVEAEDAAQETFFKAYKGLKRYDPTRSFATWLLSVASHHCIDRLRRRRFQTLSMEELLPSQEPPSDGMGPESTLAQRESKEAVRSLLQKLGSQDRATVVLRYWYEMSYEQIAETLSLTVPAVKSRLHRARRTLARSWSEQRQITMALEWEA
jgi:RNA polymerase sigma-70 factor (ECF subfamily)